ncbi:hypothetical protein ACFL6H_05290 [Candidatus Latescibacterota bacterium]
MYRINSKKTRTCLSFASLIFIFLLMSGCASKKQIAVIDGQKAEIDKANNRIAELNAKINELNNTISTTERKLKDAENDRRNLSNSISGLKSQISMLEREKREVKEMNKPDIPSMIGPIYQEIEKNTIVKEHFSWFSVEKDFSVPDGFGLYSYLLASRQPINSNDFNKPEQKRLKALLDAIQSKILVATGSRLDEAINKGVGRDEMNLYIIPVITKPIDNEFVMLTNFDYEVSLEFHRNLVRQLRDLERKNEAEQISNNPGPFLITTLYPPQVPNPSNQRILIADLSNMPESAAAEYINEYSKLLERTSIDGVSSFDTNKLRLLRIIVGIGDALIIVKAELSWLLKI